MNLSPEETQELIDRYLREELSDKDVQLLEEARKSPHFAGDLKWMEDLRQASMAQGRLQLRAVMDAWDQEMAPPTSVIRPLWQRSGFLVSLAAGISLFLAIVLWPRQSEAPDGMVLFAAHFEAYPDFQSDNTRSEGQEATLLDFTMEAYRMGEYEAALKGFDSLQSQDPAMVFYEGVSLLGAGKAEDASKTLQRIEGGAYLPPAEWYLALAEVQLEAWEKARQTLHSITDSENHPFNKDAEELLRKIPSE